jgi:hypothetical protein
MKMDEDESIDEIDNNKIIVNKYASAIPTDDVISTINKVTIVRTRDWKIEQKIKQKLYSFYFDKRIILSNLDTLPFGYVI